MKTNIKLRSCLTPKQEIAVTMLLECVKENTGIEIPVERLISDAVRCLMYRFALYGPGWYAGFNYGSNRHYIAEMRGEY